VRNEKSLHQTRVLRPFYGNATCQFTLLNLCSFVFGLTPFGWPQSITLTPYFLWEYHFWFTPFWFTPAFSGTQLGRKTRAGCTWSCSVTIVCHSASVPRSVCVVNIAKCDCSNSCMCVCPSTFQFWNIFVCTALYIHIYVGRDSVVGIATRYELDGPGIESRGARFSAPVQTGPGAYPAFCTMGTGSFPWLKRPGCGVDHPPPSIAEVKERVELYLYSPSGLSWPVLGWTLSLHLSIDLYNYNCQTFVCINGRPMGENVSLC
jgi:hypothetical protein